MIGDLFSAWGSLYEEQQREYGHIHTNIGEDGEAMSAQYCVRLHGYASGLANMQECKQQSELVGSTVM